MTINDLLDMPEEIDHSPVSGWLQKYVFLFEHKEGRNRNFYFNFANHWNAGSFIEKPMNLGGYIDHHIWIALEKWSKEVEWVQSPKTNGQPFKASGVWGVAYGHPVLKYVNEKPVGVYMFWDEFYRLPRKECQTLIKEQWIKVQAKKIEKRPHLDRYLEIMNEQALARTE